MKSKLISLFLTAHLLVLAMSAMSQASTIYNPVELLQGKKKVTIPFQYINNFIILEVRIYGMIPVHLIFDTGAEHVILFKKEYTDLLKVPYDKRIPILGSDLSRKIHALITRNALLEINGLKPGTADLLVLEEDYFDLEELIGTPIDGLLGGGFFKNLIINIDYKRQQMTLHDPSTFVKPADYISLPIRIKTNKPYIDAETTLQDGTVVTVDLLVDTGAGVPLLLHNNSNAALRLPSNVIKGKLGMGLGGYLEGYIGRINKLTLGEVEFSGVLTSFQDIESDWLVDKDRFRNGILGNQLLSRFCVYFDYLHSQMMLRPYRKRQEPFTMDRSGLVIFAYGADFDQFIVRDVIPNSPAQDIDFKPDDVLIKVQGLPVHFYNLNTLNSVLQKKPGKKIRISVNRGGKHLKKVFYLRELI
ncbi:MAG: aspartyl protease family protein [Bacteroidota bacterium]|nr:aspartyl protease family protein [Bacteroidota bacterium]